MHSRGAAEKVKQMVGVSEGTVRGRNSTRRQEAEFYSFTTTRHNSEEGRLSSDLSLEAIAKYAFPPLAIVPDALHMAVARRRQRLLPLPLELLELER
eukprot:COSAG06_NODE_14306_length_1168_cov_3.304022_1_plen_96_part_10